MISPAIFNGLQHNNGDINVLCLGAHCDDIEIGCGGSILELLQKHINVNITWVIFSSNEKRKSEAITGAKRFCESAKNLDIKIFDFSDGHLPYHASEVKSAIESVKKSIKSPDLIFTHYLQDKHQDHRFVSELTWNTFRNNLIFEYEIPKWDGDIGNPNAYTSISQDKANRKIQLLQEVYNSQKNKKWFTDDLFHSLMRIRGMECNSNSNLAEAFYIKKTVIEF